MAFLFSCVLFVAFMVAVVVAELRGGKRNKQRVVTISTEIDRVSERAAQRYERRFGRRPAELVRMDTHSRRR